MTAALIVIEISAPKLSDDALAVLVSSCTRAARGAECVLAKNAADESPSAVAIVSLQSDDKMRVEVGVRQGDHDSWRTKDFAFLAADEAMDRWRAVGFAIGTLAESEPPPADSASAAPSAVPLAPPTVAPVAPASPPHAPPSASKPAPGVRLFVGAVGLAGPGLSRPSAPPAGAVKDSSPWRIGSGVRLELAPPRGPLYGAFAASASTRVTRDTLGADVRWFDISLGPGVALIGPLTHSGLQLGVSLLVEDFDVSASFLDGRSQSAHRWLFGVESTLGGRVEVVPDLFLTADLQVADLSGATDVRVSNAVVGSAEYVRGLASFGLRVRLR
ncbi:MAG TPA: hypothetical protein VK745_02840 [Polyangiaceae bacterium]|nr:hypothetical protein [Polyangiaceae bacterium]